MNENPVALITGGAQGIGYACAEAIAENGAQIVLADVQAEKVQKAAEMLGNKTLAITCDISDPQQVNAMFAQLEADRGPASIIVNNAGIARPADFLESSLEDFQAVIDVNLVGTFAVSQSGAKAMIEHQIQGSIVNMSSVNAQVAIPSIASYCASKGGIMQLTKAAALALAPHGIRVNAIGPGSIDTEMLAGVNANPDAMKMVLSRTPLRRIGKPREIAEVAAFLVSDKASYITGETIYVDGGRLGMNYTC